MRIVQDAKLSVQECPRQHGTWFNAGEMGRLAKLKEKRNFDETKIRRELEYAAEPARRCPGCGGQSLDEGQANGLTVHSCGRCKGFFVPIATSNRLRDTSEPVYRMSGIDTVLNLLECWFR
jgi:Zn-finger nucleic acid-binding protein